MFKLPFLKKSLTTPTNSTLMLPQSSNSKFHEENYKEYIPEPNIDITWSYEYNKPRNIYTAKIIFNKIPRNYLFSYKTGYSYVSGFIVVMVVGDCIFLKKQGYAEKIDIDFSINIGKEVELTCSNFIELKDRVGLILDIFRKVQNELEGHEMGITSFMYTSFLYYKKLNLDNLSNVKPSLSECAKLMTSHRIKKIVKKSHNYEEGEVTLDSFLTQFKHIKILYGSDLSIDNIIKNCIQVIPLEEEVGKTYNFKK